MSFRCIGPELWIMQQHEKLDFRLPYKAALATSFPAIGQLPRIRPNRGTLRYRGL
jgi:hypothetical protein